MIKNIVFDMGQVLVYFRPDVFVERLGVPEEDREMLLREVFRDREWVQLDRGTLTEEEALERICRRLPERLRGAVAIFIGVCGLAVSKAGAIDTLTGSDSETIIVKIADLLSSHGILTTILAGIILAGILAATMSTADSQLLAASSSVSQNLLRDTFGINLSERSSLVAARVTVLLISIVGVFLARDPSSSVFNIVSFAWAGFGATFGPVMLCALFWKRSNKYGAFASMLSGGILIFVWKYLVRPMGGAWNIYELLPAFIIALALNVIVSLLTEKPDASIEAEFERAAGKN